VESCPKAKKSFEAPSATIRLFRRGYVAAYLANIAHDAFDYDKFTGYASRSWSIWLGRWRLLPAAARARGAGSEAAATGERKDAL
jgi:hypothetical protein